MFIQADNRVHSFIILQPYSTFICTFVTILQIAVGPLYKRIHLGHKPWRL